MTDFDNTNRGAIWNNDRKQKDTQPDLEKGLSKQKAPGRRGLKIGRNIFFQQLELPLGDQPND